MKRFVILIVGLVATCLSASAQLSQQQQIQKLNYLYQQIRNNYVDDVPLEPLVEEAIIATIKELDDYDVVMWEKHGVFAVDVDIMSAFDQVDVLNKSALIYVAAKSMGFTPDGMTDEQMAEMTRAFNLPK